VLEIDRLDQLLFDKTSALQLIHEKGLVQHGRDYPVYFESILQLGSPYDSAAVDHLDRFVSDPEWRFAQSQIDSVWQDVSLIENQFGQAFARLAVMFPEVKTPQVFMMNSGYNYGVYPDPKRGILGVGGEFYLGTDNEMVKRLPNEVFPAYMRAGMLPEQLVPDAVKGWLLNTYSGYEGERDLLGHMVIYGKVMYALHLALPEIPEHLHFNYSKAQWDWCNTQQQEIWKAIVQQELLYKKDRKTLTDWLGRGPYTQGFDQQSPAELAYYMGKEMVKDYMRAHPEVTVQALQDIEPSVILRSYSPD